MIKEDERSRIIEYIKKPMKNGLWETTYKWEANNDSFNSIIEACKNNINHNQGEISGSIPLHSFDPDYTNNPLFMLILINEISFINNAPNYVNILDKQSADLVTFIKNYIKFENKIDISKDIEKFQKEIGFIQIYSTYSLVYSNSVTSYLIIGGDVVIISQLPNSLNSDLIVLSTGEKVIKKLDTLFNFMKYAKRESKVKLFSPENKLLSPYIIYMNFVSINVFKDSYASSFFTNTYKHYNAGEYENCITSTGKACESTLTMIYETLFREKVSKGSTMGQLINTIDSKVKELYIGNQPISPASFDEIFDICNKLNKNSNSKNTG